MDDLGDSVEREVRQLRLMDLRLTQFGSNEIGIASVISDLEGLVWQLELAPEDWKDQFVEEWSELEIAYAVALDRQQPLPVASDPDIRAATIAMRRLVNERLQVHA